MKIKLKNILIPINLSSSATNALTTAIHMAKRHQATLHLLYTEDIMDYYPQMGRLAVMGPMMEDIWKNDRSLLKKLARSVKRRHRINCVLHSASGYRVAVISQQAAELNADLIVIGTEPDIQDQSYLYDSLPYKVLKSAGCHVLTVPASKKIFNFGHIIFPVLSREHPANKLDISQLLVEKNNAVVSVVSMLRSEDLNLLSLISDIAEQVKSRLKMYARSVTRSSFYTLNLAGELIGLAKEKSAQLVVISGDTHRSLKEFFFGSFTQRMIRNNEVAVLFINDQPAETTAEKTTEVFYSGALQLNHWGASLSL